MMSKAHKFKNAMRVYMYTTEIIIIQHGSFGLSDF